MINPVLATLAEVRRAKAPIFARWCELTGRPFCPAAPSVIAQFVRDCAFLGIERVWSAIQDVSRVHTSLDLADPTLGDPVAAAMSEVAKIASPRSWPDDFKERFAALPYDIQRFVAAHEIRRDRALRRAQNEAASVRQKRDRPEQAGETSSKAATCT